MEGMLSLRSTGERMKAYRDKVMQTCVGCDTDVLAIRINGFYAGSRVRIFLWECPLCQHIWRKPKPVVKNNDV